MSSETRVIVVIEDGGEETPNLGGTYLGDGLDMYMPPSSTVNFHWPIVGMISVSFDRSMQPRRKGCRSKSPKYVGRVLRSSDTCGMFEYHKDREGCRDCGEKTSQKDADASPRPSRRPGFVARDVRASKRMCISESVCSPIWL